MTEQPLTQIALPLPDIAAFCQRWGVVEFALFGSALRDDFAADSDVDVLVSFGDEVRRSLFDLATMTDELEALFGREVDLLTRKGVEESANYIRRKAILNTAQVIYAA
jgi:predicted nucleotidyltransferase